MPKPLNKYVWQQQPAPDTAQAAELAVALDIPPAGARFLLARDITNAADAELYLRGGDLVTHDPFLFDNMEAAVATVTAAIEAGKKILIHGDYDVDGISGTALLYRYLQNTASEVLRFVPDRRKDGYGVARRAVDWALEQGVGLFIAVDCGTSDGELIAELEDADVDVVVCDHHEFPVDKETRGVILNPVRDGESYPFRGLCGAGVAFKLIDALERRGVKGTATANDMMDLVALATVGDMAPLIDENRVFVRRGLEALNGERRPGLRAITREAKLEGRRITASHIGFSIAPRLNAPGRVSNAKPALSILCAEEAGESAQLARRLESDNTHRRELTEKVRRDVVQRIESMDDWPNRGGFVLSGDDWDEGVLGIAAARVVEDFGRPALLISTASGSGKGSGRSVRGVHLKEQLDAVRSHLSRYGGHAQAVGFSIDADRIGAFSDDLMRQLDEAMSDLPKQPGLRIDADLSLREATLDLVSFLEQCEPFGFGNRTPVWHIRGATVLPQTRTVGDGHMKLCVADADGHAMEGIFFGWGSRGVEPIELIGRTVDMAVQLKRGFFQNREYSELRVMDLRETEAA